MKTKKAKDLQVGDVIHARGIIYKIDDDTMYFYTATSNKLDRYLIFLPEEMFEVLSDQDKIREYYEAVEKRIEKKIKNYNDIQKDFLKIKYLNR